MLRFTIDVAGERQMDRGIARFADGVSDYRQIWPIIYDDFLAEVKAQFESEGSHGGAQWAPLTDNPEGKGYASWKAAHYPGKPILVREGDLKRSLTEKGAPGAVFHSTPRALVMGTDVPYAIFHQTGTRKMAARPEVRLTEKFKREAMRVIQEFLVQRATELGFRSGMTPGQVSSVMGAMGRNAGWKPAYMGGVA